MSSLIFEAANGQYSVWGCHCGCDGAVEVTPLMAEEAVTPRFYIRGHQPLGTAYEHIGRRFDFEAQTIPEVPPALENATSELPDALENELEWYRNDKTPVVHFEHGFFWNDDES